MIRRIIFIAVAFLFAGAVTGQELVAKVTVIATRISSTVEKRTFTTLQTQLNNLLNNRKWTDQNFKPNERIECNFILNLDRQVETNIFGGTLTVQAARPVYNSTYKSPLINWQDNDVVFKYIEYQPVEFNENRIGGSDNVTGNLTAVFAYYVYTILGMDFDSFSAGAGDPYFKKALFIVNNAPQGRNIAGWTQFDGLRNRWWLSENLLNTRYALFHDAVYQYYRGSLDLFYEDEQKARAQMMNTLNTLFTFNSSFPNTMVLQFFMQSKSDELIEVFRKATPDQKSRVVEILSKIDLTNATKYKEQLK